MINKVRQILVDLCGRADKLGLSGSTTPLEAATYKNMILEETSHEVEQREEIVADAKMSQEKKETELRKLDEAYQKSRLVNSTYFKQIRELLGKLEEEKVT